MTLKPPSTRKARFWARETRAWRVLAPGKVWSSMLQDGQQQDGRGADGVLMGRVAINIFKLMLDVFRKRLWKAPSCLSFFFNSKSLPCFWRLIPGVSHPLIGAPFLNIVKRLCSLYNLDTPLTSVANIWRTAVLCSCNDISVPREVW